MESYKCKKKSSTWFYVKDGKKIIKSCDGCKENFTELEGMKIFHPELLTSRIPQEMLDRYNYIKEQK